MTSGCTKEGCHFRDLAAEYGVRRRFLTPVKRATFMIGPDQVISEVIASELKMDVHADEALGALRTL